MSAAAAAAAAKQLQLAKCVIPTHFLLALSPAAWRRLLLRRRWGRLQHSGNIAYTARAIPGGGGGSGGGRGG